MKKFTSLIIAMLLVLGSLPITAMAATGFATDVPALTNASPVYIDSSGLQLVINPALIIDYNPENDSDKFTMQMSGLTVNGQVVPAGHEKNIFKGYPNVVLTAHQGGSISGLLTLGEGVQTAVAQPFTANVTVSYTGDEGTFSAQAALSGTIAALGTVDGFKAEGFTLAKDDLSLNGASWDGGKVKATTASAFSMSVDLKNTKFFYTQGGIAPSGQQIRDIAQLGYITPGYTAVIGDNGVLTVNCPNPSKMNGTVNVELQRKTNANSKMSLNISVEIADPVAPPPPPPTTTTSATIASGAALSVAAPGNFSPGANGIATMAQSTQVILSVPYGNFTHNGSQPAHLIDYLNANRASWIKSSHTVNYSTTPFRINGSNVELVLNIPAGNYNNFRIWLSGGNNSANAMSYPRLVIYGANPVYLSLKSMNASFNWNSSVPGDKYAMKVGESLMYPIRSDYIFWTPGTVGEDFAATLAANVNINGLNTTLFNSAFAYENGRTYLKLTAKAAGTIAASSSITLTDKTPAPVPQTLTINLPALTIQSTASATNNKITGIDPSASLTRYYKINGQTTNNYLNDLTVNPGDVITLDFDSNFFTWENGKPTPAVGLSSSLLSAGKIEMRSTTATGPVEYVRVTHKNGQSYVEIKIRDSINSTKDVKFGTTVYFMEGSRRNTASQAEVRGVVTQDSYEVYSGDFVDMTIHPVIEAAESARNVELYIGNGMTLLASLTNGRSYFASSNDDFDSKDEDIYFNYPDVEQVLHIEQTGFSEGTTKVTFEYGEKLYVYDGNGAYLGTTDDKIPLRSTYYIASRRMDMGVSGGSTSSSPSVSEIPSTSSPQSGTPSGSYVPSAGAGTSSNTNFNPNTGL